MLGRRQNGPMEIGKQLCSKEKQRVLTKSIEGLDNVAFLLPKSILVQAMRREAVHLLHFPLSVFEYFLLHRHENGNSRIKECRKSRRVLCLRGSTS